MMLWGGKKPSDHQGKLYTVQYRRERSEVQRMYERDKATEKRLHSAQKDKRNKLKYRCDEAENVERNCWRHKTEKG